MSHEEHRALQRRLNVLATLPEWACHTALAMDELDLDILAGCLTGPPELHNFVLRNIVRRLERGGVIDDAADIACKCYPQGSPQPCRCAQPRTGSRTVSEANERNAA